MTIPHTIEIVDNLLVVLDEEGNGYDSHELRSLREAKAQLRKWQYEYTFDYAEAANAISAFFRASVERPQAASRGRNDDPSAIDARLAEIAKQVFKVPTLAYRNADRLDFHEVSVGQIKLALRAAYEAGRASRE